MTALETEIREQPEALRRLLSADDTVLRDLATRIGDRTSVHGLLLAARGSSDNAARYAQYLLGARNRLQVGLATPSLFTRYRRPPRLDGLAVGAISQSGRSPDVVGVLEEANRQGRPTFALTNDPASPLAAAAGAVVDLHAGEEHAVAATKTYTASLVALARLSLALDPDSGDAAELALALDRLTVVIERSLAQVKVPTWLGEAAALAVVGRGFNYCTAFEAALKLKELTGLAAEPYSSADLLHGPVAAMSWRVPALLLAPTGVVAADVLDVADRLRQRGARLMIVSDDPAALEQADLPLPVPAGVPEWLSPLTAIIPAQVLSLRLAQARGLDVDRPSGLQKVTETR
ncbi:MAG: SIS domain-containing protein [Nitriliruptoraceae bacterium]